MPDTSETRPNVHDSLRLEGLLPVNKLLVSGPGTAVATVIRLEFARFRPDERAQDAAQAFKRHDLVWAPVTGDDGRLIGRVTVNAVMDYIREETDSDMLSAGGLREEEDLFAPVWKSVRNRWTWLAVNLVTAFIASRVIGVFEHSTP